MTTFLDHPDERPFRPGSILKTAALSALLAVGLYTALTPAAASMLHARGDSLASRTERAQATLDRLQR